MTFKLNMTHEGVTQPGYYFAEQAGSLFNVQIGLQSHKPYAKRLTVVEDANYNKDGDLIRYPVVKYVYEPGAIKYLQPDWHLDKRPRFYHYEAGRFAPEYCAEKFPSVPGVYPLLFRCIFCAQLLTVVESVRRGVGPVCIGQIQRLVRQVGSVDSRARLHKVIQESVEKGTLQLELIEQMTGMGFDRFFDLVLYFNDVYLPRKRITLAELELLSGRTLEGLIDRALTKMQAELG